MKRILLIALLLFSFAANAGLKNALNDIAELSNKWKNLSSCQKQFVLGYSAYKDGRLKEARKHFAACDGDYPALQGYITGFLRKIDEGGERFVYSDRSKENAEEISSLEKEPPSPENELKLAKAYFKDRKYGKSEEMFRALTRFKQYNLTALEYLATSLARQEKYEDAIDVNRRIVEQFPKARDSVSKAMFKIGFLYVDEERYDLAEEEFTRLQKSFPHHQKEQVKWYLAWCAYKLGNFEEAHSIFASIEKSGGKDWKDRARFWKAATLDNMGETSEAKAIYREMAERSPLSYYGILSAKRAGVDFHPFESVEDEDIDEGEDSSDDIDIGCEPLAVARELDRIGVAELVEEELESLLSSKKKDIDWNEVYKLAKRNDAWHVVNILARGRFHKQRNGSTGRWVWEGTYPKAYENAVVEFALKNRVDPLFAYSIMREESTFRRGVVSRSGAVGLMQLMPFTAERMMQGRGRFDVKELTDPRYNIEAGVNYLGFLTKHYNKNLFRASASYNAGEEAVDRWVKKADGLSDEEFVEEIPYKETIDYVRKVMRSYWIYSELYK